MKQGYLNLVYKSVGNYVPKEHETNIVSIIFLMNKIKNNDLTIQKIAKKPINKISVLLIGDTDDKARNIVFEKETDNEISMKFLPTAYKNNPHRYTDDFNVLLYEYGINILVDLAQNSYDYKSITLNKKLEKINCIIESKLYNIKLKIEL